MNGSSDRSRKTALMWILFLHYGTLNPFPRTAWFCSSIPAALAAHVRGLNVDFALGNTSADLQTLAN
jgi:hypothetical protein